MANFKHFLALLLAATLWAQTIDNVPRTVAGTTTTLVYASQLPGVVLDCVNLTSGQTAGGGACTDNTAAINTALATATCTGHRLKLVLDGATATTGIAGPSGGCWTIEGTGWGSGLFMLAGSNSFAIRNTASKNTWTNGGAPGTPGVDIQLRNFRINGNRGNGTSGNTTGGDPNTDPSGNYIFGIYLENMKGVRIENVWAYQTPSFAVHLNACSDCIVSGLRAEGVPGTSANSFAGDGVHIDGPSAQIRISNAWCSVNDDCIALNAAEGFGGTIRDVSIDGEHCAPCQSFLRTVSDEGSSVNAALQNVVLTNFSGTIQTNTGTAHGFILGVQHSNTPNADISQSVKISNGAAFLASAGSQMVSLIDNIGELSFSNVTWMSPQDAQPWLGGNPYSVPFTVASFNCTACRIIRNTAGSAGAYFASIQTGVTVKRFECNGCSIEDESGQSYAAAPYAIDVQPGGAISNLVLTALDPAHISVLLNGAQYARVASLYGAGVSTFFRNVIFAALPPASYTGLTASISDSAAVGVWGAIETGASPGHYAQLGSNGTNWTVTGK